MIDADQIDGSKYKSLDHFMTDADQIDGSIKV